MKPIKETFKAINGYEGIYEISNLGRVKSLSRQRSENQPHMILKEKYLKHAINTSGYKFVYLTKNRIHKGFLIHRLIAKAFIPNPENKRCVNHKDSNTINNHIYNLEWCTHKENISHMIKNDRSDWTKACKGESHGRSKLTVSKVIDIKKKIVKGLNNCELGREYKVSPATIWYIRKGINWSEVKL